MLRQFFALNQNRQFLVSVDHRGGYFDLQYLDERPIINNLEMLLNQLMITVHCLIQWTKVIKSLPCMCKSVYTKNILRWMTRTLHNEK